MDKASKKDLLAIIAKQDEDLKRYRTRLQDVVAAHKRLIKENEALHLSLRVLGKSSSQEIEIDSSNDEIPVNLKPKVEEDEANQDNEDADQLKNQLTTLMNSIATLSEEKSKMEASFQADRKQMRTEKEDKDKLIKDLQKQLDQSARAHQNELENYKSKLIVERHQREKEHNDHGVMIRELQKLLAEERTARETIEAGAEGVRREWTQYRSAAERRERELSNTVEALRRKLRREKDSATPLLSTLQEEMASLKQQHSIALLREQERAREAEDRAAKLAAMHEERVANLEARLAELSQTVGSYDRLRQDDQGAIFKLQERLIQLELEHGAEKADTDLDVLMEKFQHLKNSIEVANETAEKPVDLKGILREWQEKMLVEGYTSTDHSLCHQEYMSLKAELERCKQQAASSSSVTTTTNSASDEFEHLKKQIASLKEKINFLNNELEQTHADHKLLMEEQNNELKKERARWKEKLSSVEQEHRRQLATLEQQLSKQRERALALVQEKDTEISSLKASFHTLLPTRAHKRSQSSDNDGSVELDTEGMSEGRHMLHYAHESARYQVDVAKLRKQSHRLETQLRDTQRAAAEERVTLTQRVTELQNQVDRLERCQSREGANLEYLKNVVLSYLVSNDSSCKAHMLNAIAAVLKFSEQEQQRVRQTSWYTRSGSLA
ncbi:GRIP and coiled-coil domain-containing protein 1 [Macrosteles quadrilineatus]|uniref:GRIP and coiled-coil domain-containing protein 1 n=1 Tax=Macrosteles quadrilineatus TaxID=74068 RepID=UPI0023E13995|nr:GRIP and coiled-coil domain-containing protein 1 [Macrosteles quadrilineatus]